jgi:hypothetical protein
MFVDIDPPQVRRGLPDSETSFVIAPTGQHKEAERSYWSVVI